MIYRVEVSPAAQRNFRRIVPRFRYRIESAICRLAVNPHPRGSVKLRGEDRLWRIRVGRFRVVYEVRPDMPLVVILMPLVVILKVARRNESTY